MSGCTRKRVLPTIESSICEKNCLEVFRNPLDGEYESHVVIDRKGRVSPLAFPKLKLPLTQVFDWYET